MSKRNRVVPMGHPDGRSSRSHYWRVHTHTHTHTWQQSRPGPVRLSPQPPHLNTNHGAPLPLPLPLPHRRHTPRWGPGSRRRTCRPGRGGQGTTPALRGCASTASGGTHRHTATYSPDTQHAGGCHGQPSDPWYKKVQEVRQPPCLGLAAAGQPIMAMEQPLPLPYARLSQAPCDTACLACLPARIHATAQLTCSRRGPPCPPGRCRHCPRRPGTPRSRSCTMAAPCTCRGCLGAHGSKGRARGRSYEGAGFVAVQGSSWLSQSATLGLKPLQRPMPQLHFRIHPCTPAQPYASQPAPSAPNGASVRMQPAACAYICATACPPCAAAARQHKATAPEAGVVADEHRGIARLLQPLAVNVRGVRHRALARLVHHRDHAVPAIGACRPKGTACQARNGRGHDSQARTGTRREGGREEKQSWETRSRAVCSGKRRCPGPAAGAPAQH
jgi:hypothetical protein